MALMTNITARVIAEMLTEPTGTHHMDSGGDSDRHWQRNEGKTLEDFQNEPRLQLEWETDKKEYVQVFKSLFHHLNESVVFDAHATEDLTSFLDKYKDSITDEWLLWRAGLVSPRKTQNEDGELITEFVTESGVPWWKQEHIYKIICSDNSSNTDCVLSQTIQWKYNCMFDPDLVVLQIHGGADIRGGYTDWKVFSVDESFFAYDRHYYNDKIREWTAQQEEQNEA